MFGLGVDRSGFRRFRGSAPPPASERRGNNLGLLHAGQGPNLVLTVLDIQNLVLTVFYVQNLLLTVSHVKNLVLTVLGVCEKTEGFEGFEAEDPLPPPREEGTTETLPRPLT